MKNSTRILIVLASMLGFVLLMHLLDRHPVDTSPKDDPYKISLVPNSEAAQIPLSPNFSAQGGAPVYFASTSAGGPNSTTNVTLFAAPGAGRFNYLYQVSCNNLTSTVTNLQIKNGIGTAAAVIGNFPCPPSGANGGVVTLNPPLRQATANTAMGAALSVAVTSAMVYASGFTAAQ